VYVYSEDACTCECFDIVGGAGGKFNVGSLIAVSVKGLTLGQLAARFDRLLVREVLVPAGRSREKITLQIKRASFASVLKQLGLSTRRRPHIRRG
jgi:hypothetical protein